MQEAEKAVIGALLLDGKAIERCGLLRAEQFDDEILGGIYREFQRGYDIGAPVTPASLAQELSITRDGMAAFTALLAECSGTVATSVGIESDAAAVRRAWKTRKAAASLSHVELTPAGIDKQIGEIVTELEGLQDESEVKPKSARQLVKEAAGRYFTDKHKNGLKTNFQGLDDVLGGLCGGDVITLAARPAVGKSAFALQLLTQICQQGKRALYFNLEMTDAQVFERLLSQFGGLSLQRIRRAVNFQGNELQRYTSACSKIHDLDLWTFSGARTVPEIRRLSKHMGADVIAIDYLQLVRADERYQNRAAEVGAVSKAIKRLAMELNIPIILLSQLNRASEMRETREPNMSELRESGDVEQDSSVVMLLWNLDDERIWKGCKIDKNRQGMVGKVCFAFNGEEMRFEENPRGFEVMAQKEERQRQAPKWRT